MTLTRAQILAMQGATFIRNSGHWGQGTSH